MMSGRTFFQRSVLAIAIAMPVICASAHADDKTFMKPTKEELEMKSMPGYPGAAAVILTLDEEDNNQMHYQKFYKRIKILTEKGKDLADVQLGYGNSTEWDAFDGNADVNVADIQGRTIHPDGTIVPFTGKPYTKTIAKDANFKVEAKVFSLPDVQVGDIIEYRYAIRMADNWFDAPDWYLQGPYFIKSAHFTWTPTSLELAGADGGIINAISWFPILPKGAEIKNREIPGGGQNAAGQSGAAERIFELTVKDIPPVPEESFAPPTASFTYRVLFNFTEYRSNQEFWAAQGKQIGKRVDSFTNPSGEVRSAAQAAAAGATSSDDKLKRIYDVVEQMENTDFTREHGQREDKAQGLGKISNAGDILARKRGNADQLTELFISMAKAAGFKAYWMYVPDRTHRLFAPGWMSTRQFDNMIAVVNVDGKEVFLDPGERFMPYGHLAWQHTFVNGLRAVDGGTALGQTSGDGYKYNHTTRVANLTMDETGLVTGKIDMTYTGAAAVDWRQRALRGDNESIKRSLRSSLERQLPRSLDVKVESMENLSNYEQPLKVSYTVKGAIGNATGTRLLVPADVFTANESATFPQQKREQTVYFHYPQMMQDALRINLPTSMQIEATPDPSNVSFLKMGAYAMKVDKGPTSVTTRRDYIFGEVAVPVENYAELRTFYSQYQGNDKQHVVLKSTGAALAVEASTKADDDKPGAPRDDDKDDDN